MRTGFGARRRVAAAFGLFAVLGAIAVGGATPASAADEGAAKIWVGPFDGPSCPSGWTCQESGAVTQKTDGNRSQEVMCTLQSCTVTQENVGGSNKITIDQSVIDNKTDLSVGDLEQIIPAQTGTTSQGNETGTNSLTVTQSITASATTNVNLPATQTQEAHQSLNVIKQQSTTGNQSISVTQTENLTQDLEAISANQTQNSSNEIGQDLVIGGAGNVGMDTTSGLNTVTYSQIQNFTQKARGFGAVPLTSSTQTQGALDETFPAANVDWKVESDAVNGSTICTSSNPCPQTKNWLQDTTPDAPQFGKTQNMWDELKILGRLPTTDFSFTTQKATLTQDGSFRRCVQHGDVHNDVTGTLTQNCNGQTQSASGEHYVADSRCINDTCTTQTVTEVEPAEEGDPDHLYGCSDGFWKHDTSVWPADPRPEDRFGDQFTGANARFPALANETMFQAVSDAGGTGGNAEAAAKLGRVAVAALLNAQHSSVPYELHSKDVQLQVNDQLASGNKSSIMSLANTLASYNTGTCPLA
jgi:hypothetical protein